MLLPNLELRLTSNNFLHGQVVTFVVQSQPEKEIVL